METKFQQKTKKQLKLIFILKDAIKADNVEDIKTKTQTLMQSSMKWVKQFTKAQQANPDAGSGNEKNTDSEKKEDVVDAEFEEVKDSKDDKKDSA